MNKKEKREWRSNSFSLLMKERKYALETYNLLNDSDYSDEQMVEILEFDGGFSLSVRNDAAFILDSTLSLYEHQSSVNPNMPLRFLIYTANLYRHLTKSKDVFGSSLIKLPEPKYVVFYNGSRAWGEDFELILSDAYEKASETHFLELKCRVININPGYNEKLKESSAAIRGYCIYVEKARKYSYILQTEDAIKKAIDECIKEGVLADFFKENEKMIISMDTIDGTYETRMAFARRELEEAGAIIKQKDEEIKNINAEIILLRDLLMKNGIDCFKKENTTKTMTMEEWDYTVEAREKWAMQEGIERGIEQGRRDMIRNALKTGSTPEVISQVTGIPMEEILKVQEECMS